MNEPIKKKLLIVEDDEDILFVLTDFFESHGYKVLTALNGLLALELLEKNEFPNLVLLDMMMPIMNGWQFRDEFVARYDNECPIIVMTAAADAKKRSEEIGAAAWVAKPFNLDNILKLVKKFER